MILTMDNNQFRGRMAACPRQQHHGKHISGRRVIPQSADVLLGRGHSLHPGNLAYRRIICNYLPIYSEAKTNKEKTRITKQIVAQVRQMGGRFLKEDPHGDKMLEMGDDNVRLRVGQALRHQLRIMDHKDPATAKTLAVKPDTAHPKENLFAELNSFPSGDSASDFVFADEQLSSEVGPLTASHSNGVDQDNTQMQPEAVQSIGPNVRPSLYLQKLGGTSNVPIDVDQIIDDSLIQDIDLIEGDFSALNDDESQPNILLKAPSTSTSSQDAPRQALGAVATVPSSLLQPSLTTSSTQQDNRLVHIVSTSASILHENGTNILGV